MELTGELSSEECEEILSELNSRQDNVSFHQNQSDTLVNEKKLINLLVLDKNRKPKMLSEIFAIAQREIKAMKELEYKRQKELHVAPISTDNA